MPTAFSTLLSQVRTEAGESQVDVPEDWLQGRTLFGGLQAALALSAMRSRIPEAPLRTLQATFLAPVPGGPVHARARILRTGRSATHVEARIIDGDETLALMIGVFGLARPSIVSLRPQQPVVAPGSQAELPYIPGVVPAFTQHFRARWLRGEGPFAGVTQDEVVVDLGLRDAGPASEYHVLALADFIPPIALSWMKAPTAGASLTWMLELLAADVRALPLDGWRVDARMTAAGGGYTSQSLLLWGPGGVPVALGHQSMVVFG